MAARPHIYIVGFSLVDQPVTIKIETATQELGLTSKASPGFCELKQRRTRLIKIRESSRSVYKKNQKTSSSCSYRVIETIIKACENSEKLRKQSPSILLPCHFSFSFVKSLLDWTVIWNLLVRFYYNQFPVTDHWSVFQGKYTKRAFSSL